MRQIIDSLSSKINQQASTSLIRLILLGLLLTSCTGCSIFHPVRGVPASYLPNEFEGPRRGGKRTINPSLLVQTPPDQHRIAAGDVLSIYIPGVLGRIDAEVRELGVEPPINQPYSEADPPTIGYPITVRDDNTIALPQVPPINVLNKTLHETELAIRKAYTEDFNILRPEEAMILVSLQRPRVHRILVVRQETGNELASGGDAGTINIGVSKRGTARVVTLKAYENDVLHALSMEDGVDGLPGLDAENTIYIIRRRPHQVKTHIGHPGIPANPPSPHQFNPIQQLPANSHIRQMSYNETASNHQEVVSAGYEYAGRTQSGHSLGVHQVQHSLPGAQLPPLPTTPSVPPSQATQPSPQLIQPRSMSPYGGHSIRGSAPAPQYAPGPALPPADTPSLPVSPQYQQGSPVPSYQGLQQQPAVPQQMAPPAPQWTPPMVPPVSSPTPVVTENWSSALQNFDPTIDNPNVIRIPIRLAQGEQPNITEEMIKLNDGDIVFIESRETDVFYTGGLLGGGQYTLPREYDLGVLEAISVAEGRSNGGGGNSRSVGGVSALNRDVSVSASRVIILRTLPTSQRITIEVDLHKAMKYQEENILIQPGDMIILQYTAMESIAAITQRYLLEGALFGLAAAQFNSGGGN